MHARLIWLGLSMFCAALPQSVGAQQALPAAVAEAPVGRLSLEQAVSPFGMALRAHLAGRADVAAVYDDHGWTALWTDPARAPARRALFQALDQAELHGLPSARYDVAGLRAAFQGLSSEPERIALEAAMMRAFVDYTHDVSSGVLEPRSADYGIKRQVKRPDPVALMRAFAASAQPARVLRDLLPQDPAYVALLAEKKRLEHVLAVGPLAKARGARPGDNGAAVVALRDRLQALGFMSRSATAFYDDEMAAAVRAFQRYAGLPQDGVAGAGTVNALNRDPARRLGEVLVTMERLRWMRGQPREGRYIWVNIPEFNVRLMDGEVELFRSATVVGKNASDTRTPEFSEMMTHMVVNPAWNVPRSITVKEYLPRLQANPGALGHLEVVGRGGRVVSRSQIDFNAYTARTFPYRLRQPPAARNALGQVKFMFPNPWNIYLHDTPSKQYFRRSSRMFSHGCVRVGAPFGLAEALLAPQTENPRSTFRGALAHDTEQVIHLKPPIPVHLVYFTLWPTPNGGFRRYPDVYGRDARIRRALAKAGVEFAGAGD